MRSLMNFKHETRNQSRRGAISSTLAFSFQFGIISHNRERSCWLTTTVLCYWGRLLYAFAYGHFNYV